jgi:hypothetical protein
MEFIIDCADIHSPEELHRAIAAALSFPGWYGHNLDALYDCLCSLTDNTSLVFSGWDCVMDFAAGFHRVLIDAQMDNLLLTVTFE